MQLRFSIGLTSEEYVSREAWREARLERCPLHPQGGCSFARHGTYQRVSPPGTRIARWYCPQAHRTFSLLPDCLAARFSGTLQAFEAVVDQLEQTGTREQAADRLRLDIELPGALRWLRRRAQAVHAELTLLKGLQPEQFFPCEPTLGSFRRHLGMDPLLPALRAIVEPLLPRLPPPLGFAPRLAQGGEPRRGRQHRVGPDPP